MTTPPSAWCKTTKTAIKPMPTIPNPLSRSFTVHPRRCLRFCSGLFLALAWLVFSAAQAQAATYALGTASLLESPAAERIAWCSRHAPDECLDQHSKCRLVASQLGESNRHRQHQCNFQFRCQSGRDAHRHLLYRQPDPHRHPGRFNLCPGCAANYIGVLGSAHGCGSGRRGQRLFR